MSTLQGSQTVPPRCGVVLFDIDGTLVDGPPDLPSAGFVAMGLAATEVTGVSMAIDTVDFAGQTDGNIARLLIEAAGRRPDPASLEKLLQRYLWHLAVEIGRRPYRPLGNAAGAVQALRQAGFICGIGTGNLRPGAMLKLRSAGVADHFNLDLGGYAEDSSLRSELIGMAAQRCDPNRQLPVIVVGDTKHDVEAALAIGGHCVGVPFRKSTAKSLMSHGAACVVAAVGPALADICCDLLQKGQG